jgi:transcriptional regulator with XRE-family HTH domain
MEQTNERLTPTELCARLGVKESTLATWRCKGTGPDYMKIGGIFYALSAVVEWELKRTRKGGEK